MSRFSTGFAALRRWSGQHLEERSRPRDFRETTLLSLVVLFIFSNAIAYSLLRESAITWHHLYAPVCWLITIAISHFAIKYLRPTRDPFLLPIFALLTGWGLLLQDRLASNFLPRQTIWFALATIALLLTAILPRTLAPLMRYRYVLLTGGLILLAITLIFGVNPSGNGAALWLPISFPFLGIIHFQPSELLKLFLVIFLASYFTEQEPLHRLRQEASRENGSSIFSRFWLHLPFLGPLLIMWGLTILLLVWQQDLGAAALFFIVFLVLLFLATGERIYVWSGFALLLLAGLIAFFAFDTVVGPRVISWLNPWPYANDRAYQIVQALYAVANGGLFGQGIGQGFPDYIPVVHSDFALVAIAEEWGLIGTLTIVASFALLAGRGLRTALLVIRGARPNHFNSYLAAGLITLLSVQAVLIMGGSIRLLPLTGITLPFVSYGGSSLLVSSIALGLLLYLSSSAESVPPVPPDDFGLALRLERLGVVLLIIFGIVSATLTFWAIVRSDSLLAHQDNPRLVELERRIQRGRILDRNDIALALSQIEIENSGTSQPMKRIYPIREVGPTVGYYSWRFGSIGIENTYNIHLQGQDVGYLAQIKRELFHEPQVGGDVQLTLDAGVQIAATNMMAASGATGGLVLLELTEVGGVAVAKVRAIVSLPDYDPNLIDEQFAELTGVDPGPLFDRATQGLYQPGMILQTPIVAAAVDGGIIRWQDALIDPSLPIIFEEQVLRCTASREEVEAGVRTWIDQPILQCPNPQFNLGQRLGTSALEEIFNQFGFRSAPALEILANRNSSAAVNAGLAAIGQELLTVSPLQAALATSVIAGDGRLPVPQLVGAISDPNNKWVTQVSGNGAVSPQVISKQTAGAARDTWLAVSDVRGFATSALAGPEGNRDTWYLGMAPSASPRFVVAIVLEDESDTKKAEQIGRDILNLALAP